MTTFPVPDLCVGEIVDMHIQALQVMLVNQDDKGPRYMLATSEGAAIEIPRDLWFTVTRKVPAEGEPQPGEIWANRFGEHYYVQRQGTVGIRLVPATTGGNASFPWTDVHRAAEGPIHRVYQPPVVADGGDQA
jgi:hypothetical protein